jgi:hypothetical protein
MSLTSIRRRTIASAAGWLARPTWRPKLNRRRIQTKSYRTARWSPWPEAAKEFWIVDPERRLVTVYTPGSIHTYTDQDAIPTLLLGGGEIFVRELFP